MDEAEASEAHEEQTEASEGDANTGSSGEAQDQPETVDEADDVKAKGRSAATRGPAGSCELRLAVAAQAQAHATSGTEEELAAEPEAVVAAQPSGSPPKR